MQDKAGAVYIFELFFRHGDRPEGGIETVADSVGELPVADQRLAVVFCGYIARVSCVDLL